MFKSSGWRGCGISALTLFMVAVVSSTTLAASQESLIRVSSDPYTNPDSQHRTEVEPDTFAFGKTIVSAFQVGRFPDADAGSSNIGWATSTDEGKTWTHGFLPGITKVVNPTNPYNRATNASVAYNRKYQAWLIASLPFKIPVNLPSAVVVSRSTNGGTEWEKPITVASEPGNLIQDKSWIVCDNTATSPFYGHCYVEWDDAGNNSLIRMSTSTDGGKTWSTPKTTANHATGSGGQPLVLPNGTVVVPIGSADQMAILSFISTNGGASWSRTVRVAHAPSFNEQTQLNLRNGAGLPSAEIDASGKVYVTWQDCRFERDCKANDIVMSTSSDGIKWSRVQRIPIDPINSGVDHLLPGLGVDRSTDGKNAHLGLTYYYLSNVNCTTATCQLNVGFISSTNGGKSWSNHKQLAGPMKLTWLPLSQNGRMIGDYISTSILPGSNAVTVFPVAHKPEGNTTCGLGVVCDQAMYTAPEGLMSIVGGTNTSDGDKVVATSQSSGGDPQQGYH
jgi:hypothetical protein